MAWRTLVPWRAIRRRTLPCGHTQTSCGSRPRRGSATTPCRYVQLAPCYTRAQLLWWKHSPSFSSCYASKLPHAPSSCLSACLPAYNVDGQPLLIQCTWSLQNIPDKQRREGEDAALDAVPTKASGIQLPQAPAQPAAAAAGEKRRNRWDQSGDT